MFVAWFSKEGGLSSLRAGVGVVSVCCVGITDNAQSPLQWPETEICWFKFDRPHEFVKCLHIADGRRRSTRGTARESIAKGILCTRLQPIDLAQDTSI